MLADSPEELICLAATDSTLAATDSTAPIGVVPIENSGNTESRLVLIEANRSIICGVQ